MPTHPCFRPLLPLATILYGKPYDLQLFYTDRPAETVRFETGFSQGCSSGSGFANLTIHFAVDQALKQLADAEVTIFSIHDDITIQGPARNFGPIFVLIKNIIKHTLHVEIKLSKSTLLALS